MNRICFPRIAVTTRERERELRTDANFRNRYQPEHHRYYSALEELPIDMIRDIPTSDSLHLLHLGVMKRFDITTVNKRFQFDSEIERSSFLTRMLTVWMGKRSPFPRAWSDVQMVTISDLLIRSNDTKPSDIHRSTRTLKQLSHWKGTELRTFLNYVGIVVSKDFLCQDLYEMFIKLFCAVTICSTNAYADYLPKARDLFIEFIEDHINFYGEHSITMNIHNLSHVVDDVEHFGDLESMSSYQFENSLYHLKISLKQCKNPLAQISRRIHEQAVCHKPISIETYFEGYPKLNKQFVLDNGLSAYRQIQLKYNIMFANDNKNCWILIETNKIIEFRYAFKKDNRVMIRGDPLKSINNFFEKPFSSSYINVFMSDGAKDQLEINCGLSAIKAKLFCLPYKDNFVFIPLTHSL